MVRCSARTKFTSMLSVTCATMAMEVIASRPRTRGSPSRPAGANRVPSSSRAVTVEPTAAAPSTVVVESCWRVNGRFPAAISLW